MNDFENHFMPNEEALDQILSEATEEQKKALLVALHTKDWKGLNVIAEKFGFKFLTIAKNDLDDNQAEFLADLMSRGLDVHGFFASAGDILGEAATDKRHSKVSLENHYEIINEVKRLDESMYASAEKDLIVGEHMGKDVLTVLKAYMVADVLGCNNLKRDLISLYSKLHTDVYLSKSSELFNRKMVISQDRRNAKKGKTNRHHAEAIKIASNTWGKYPNASLAGLSEDITSYLRISWTDVPVVGTIEKWLKESGLNPDVKPKNRNYKLIIE